jgi:hypothetical protein
MEEGRAVTKPNELRILRKYGERYNAIPRGDRARRRQLIVEEPKPELRQHGIEGWDERRIRIWLNNAKEGKNERCRNYYRTFLVPLRMGLLPPPPHERDADKPEAAPHTPKREKVPQPIVPKKSS